MLLITWNSPLVSPRCFRRGSSTALVVDHRRVRRIVGGLAAAAEAMLAFSLPRNAAAHALNGT